MLRITPAAAARLVGLALLLVACNAVLAQAHGDTRPEKTGILLVAFGTSVPEARAAYDTLDVMVRQAWPDVEVRWAYTSKMIRNKLAGQGTDIPSPAEALARMADEDFTRVAVQSLHVIPGEEYHGLVRTAHAFAGMPKGIREVLVGRPLLTTSEQLADTARTVLETLADQRTKGQALVLMGHGTHHPGDVIYAALQYHFSRLDPTVLVGTVEGVPTLDDVLAMLQERGLESVLLAPLMAVAGDHARNDMAGDEPDSWKSSLEARGVAVTTLVQGLAEFEPLAALWLERLQDVMSHFERDTP